MASLKDRFSELDGLRGIAVMLVLLSHYTWAYDYHFKSLDQHSFHFPHGEFGVQLFFIISGYVIFLTISKTNDVKEFFISRFSRLYPTYWFCLLLTTLVIICFPIPTLGGYTLKQIFINLTMIQGFLKTKHIDQVYWSLGIELVFYFLIGVLFKIQALSKILFYSAIWLLLSAGLFFLDIRFSNIVRTALITEHAPLFISGICFYHLRNNLHKNASLILLMTSFLYYQFQLYFVLKDRNQYELTCTPFILLALAYIVFYMAIKSKANILNSKILQFLGFISYPLYLIHNVIGYVIIYNLQKYTSNQFVYFAITTTIMILVAWVISIYIEKPSNYYVRNKIHSLLKN